MTSLAVLALVCFGVAASLVAPRVRTEPVPCTRLEAASSPRGDPESLPVIAVPGHVRDLGGAVPGDFRFERELGAFRVRYAMSAEEPRWGVGHATLTGARACDAHDLGVEVPTPSSDLRLRQAPGDVYVLTAAAAPASLGLPFRAVPGAHLVWTGLRPAALATGALLTLAGALLVVWIVRRRATRLAAWVEGVVGPSGTVVSANGGAALFARGPSLPPGTPILHAPPRSASPYRSARAEVDFVAGARANLDAWEATWRARGLGLLVVSMVGSAAAAAVALSS